MNFVLNDVLDLCKSYLKMSASQMNPRKRKNFSIKEKLEIVVRVRKGQQGTAICREQGIPESTLRGLLKDEKKTTSGH